LEEVVMVLRQHHEMPYYTNIDSKKLYPISRLVSETMHMPVQANKAIVGSNAFAHSSGIHQDGFLKNRENYEIIDPNDVGVTDSQIVLTARSGRAALSFRLRKLGFAFEKPILEKAYEKFLEIADIKKEVNDEDLKKLVKQMTTPAVARRKRVAVS
jgi:2-isopropylmalate synthase